jgi:hypothetical protein
MSSCAPAPGEPPAPGEQHPVSRQHPVSGQHTVRAYLNSTTSEIAADCMFAGSALIQNK